MIQYCLCFCIGAKRSKEVGQSFRTIKFYMGAKPIPSLKENKFVSEPSNFIWGQNLKRVKIV